MYEHNVHNVTVIIIKTFTLVMTCMILYQGWVNYKKKLKLKLNYYKITIGKNINST